MELDPRRCIFPVMLHRGELDNVKTLRARDADFLGSGFFVEGSRSIAFLTARHVVDIPVGPGQMIGIGNLADNKAYAWSGFDYHDTADLAIARFPKGSLPEWISPLPTWFAPLLRGNSVHSFGFPFSGAKRVVGERLN